ILLFSSHQRCRRGASAGGPAGSTDTCRLEATSYLSSTSLAMNPKRAFPLVALTVAAISIAAAPIKPELLSGLVWRNVGPCRAGRISAVSGVIGEPGTFYIGLPAGGVWKTTNAGATWWPIFDNVKDADVIGAVEVAPSSGTTIYVGTGDLIAGGGNAEGNGMYKSTDAGA